MRSFFACLAIHIVHIEVAHSLETDCFLMALKGFIARRGHRQGKIRCDNGTNFTGREREFKESINAWNDNKIQEALLQKRI